MVDGAQFSVSATYTELVGAAAAGDGGAWQALVAKAERVVWKAVNMMTHDPEIRKDAFAATWLRLVERLDTIREPEKIPGWLATTATNEVRQILRNRNQRNTPVDWNAPPHTVGALLDNSPGAATGEHEGDMVAAELQQVIRAAFAQLDAECREIVTVLVLADPPIPYREAERATGPPGRRPRPVSAAMPRQASVHPRPR